MSEKMPPLPKISAEESVSLTDLLSKILRYEPGQRISLEDLARHPWLKATNEQITRSIRSLASSEKPLRSRNAMELDSK